jgi:glycosyltransferase involved in cell wall biosynthesis
VKLVHQSGVFRDDPLSVRLLCVFRNEAQLLEAFIRHYFGHGVTDFIFVDNGSDDRSLDIIAGFGDAAVKVYQTGASYRDAAFGMDWINALLAQYCRNRFCILADCDELLVLDGTLAGQIAAMEAAGSNAVAAYLIDMYPRQINNAYVAGTSLIAHSPYFDVPQKKHYRLGREIYGGFRHRSGGMRERVFGKTVCLHKFPVFKYDFHPIGVATGCHYFQSGGELLVTSQSIRLAPDPVGLLHFKFVKPDLAAFVARRISENQDWQDSAEYRAYDEKLRDGPALSLFDAEYSRRFVGYEDVVRFHNFGKS